MTEIDPRVIQRLHDDLVAWLRREHPRADMLVVITALSYEIGRCVGHVTEGMSEAQIAAMLDGVRDVMEEHVRAFRRGLRT